MKSVKEFADNHELGEEAWRLWKNENWTELEELFNKNNWEGVIYPPNDGFISFKIASIEEGRKIDRYGGYLDEVTGEFKDTGKFLGNDGEKLTNRALPAGSSEKYYSQYEVVKEIPEVKQGEAIPWFGEKGKGVPYFYVDFIELVKPLD